MPGRKCITTMMKGKRRKAAVKTLKDLVPLYKWRGGVLVWVLGLGGPFFLPACVCAYLFEPLANIVLGSGPGCEASSFPRGCLCFC